MELQPGQPLMLTGELENLPGVMRSEVVFLDEAIHSGGLTQLTFKAGLQNAYLRKTITLSANVVAATHGETVKEIIGSGEGTRANQRFKLKRPPLTHTSAATASGTLSSLEIRVNGIRWDQAQRLYGLTPQDERYLVQQDDDGTSYVIFGDGERAARLPTGAENVVAIYRSGAGSEGMLAAQKLTLLQSRPLGVRGVTNPLPSSGAADPENRDDAKVNAPLTVLTLDRIVSVQDFEDFARAFAGIGKARACRLWDGNRQIVHLTVAGAAAIAPVDEDEIAPAIASYVVEPGSVLFQNLEVAMAQACDPAHRFVVRPYTPLFFNVTARVLVNPRYLQSTVFAAVESALKAAFAFERRGFSQPVTVAEVITTIQQVEGVIAVDLNQLYQYEEGEPPPPPEEERIVDPLVPVEVRSRDDLAQLLLINPVGIRIEEMTP
jgi:predicted phage baseplate assembly protein